MKKEPNDRNINSHTEEMSPEEMVCGSWAHTDDTGLTTTFTLNQDKTGSIYMTVEEYNYSEKKNIIDWKINGSTLTIHIDTPNGEYDETSFNYTVTETTLTLDNTSYTRE